MSDFGMRKELIKVSLISNLTSISNLKRKFTLKQNIKSQHTLIGFKLNKITGLFKMLQGHCGSIIFKMTKNNLFIPSIQVKSMISLFRLSITASSLLVMMDLLDCGIMEIKDSFTTEDLRLMGRRLALNGCHFLKRITEGFLLLVFQTVLFVSLVFNRKNLL